MQKALALLLSAAMLLCLHPAAAQQPNTLTGTVTDSASGKAVGYATVSLQRDSATVVNAVAADTDGRDVQFVARGGLSGRFTENGTRNDGQSGQADCARAQKVSPGYFFCHKI